MPAASRAAVSISQQLVHAVNLSVHRLLQQHAGTATGDEAGKTLGAPASTDLLPQGPSRTWYLLLSTLRVLLPRISLPPKHTATSWRGAVCGGWDSSNSRVDCSSNTRGYHGGSNTSPTAAARSYACAAQRTEFSSTGLR